MELNKIGIYVDKFLMKFADAKFNENPFRGSRDGLCEQTDGDI